MLAEFTDLLRCVRCGDILQLTSFEEEPGGQEIIDGMLTCQCRASYPIVGAIPRMLKGAYRMFPEFVEKYRDRLELSPDDSPSSDPEFHKAQSRTQRSFGYQWTTFSEIATDYRNNFLTYLHPATEETFRGRLGLDVGCGFGRHLLQAAECGANIVGVDFSDAIESSYANTKHLPNVRLVQADIYDLPFAPGTFEFVYSVGVLHHLPDPELGLGSIAPLVKPGGDLFVWLYSKQRRFTNFLLELVRAATSRMPHSLVNGLSLVAASVDQYLFVTPYRALQPLPVIGKIVDWITPSRIEVYSHYPFQVLYADWFDRLAAPIRFYYSGDEVAEMLRRVGISEIQVSPTGLYGWRGCGTRDATD